jgi:hypothetical protein
MGQLVGLGYVASATSILCKNQSALFASESRELRACHSLMHADGLSRPTNAAPETYRWFVYPAKTGVIPKDRACRHRRMTLGAIGRFMGFCCHRSMITRTLIHYPRVGSGSV